MFRALSRGRKIALGAVATAGVGAIYVIINPGSTPIHHEPVSTKPPAPWTPPTRKEMLDRLKASTRPGQEFDVLVVGGGATGSGVAVDAATRGLKVALVERDDFGSGTSSKSTKLVHGGVRYLEKAFWELDYEQYKLVREALFERRVFLTTAPHLSGMLPIMLPIYTWWKLPYYWAGCKAYDFLAGKENMESSYLMSKGKSLEAFPMLNPKSLVGSVVYYDGQHNDSRMNISLIMTAVKHGATVTNYTELTSLIKDDAGKITGAEVRDTLTGETWTVKAKGVINATGPFADEILSVDNPKEHQPIVSPSSGVHITLPNYYSPRKMGLLDAQTSDGRVIFFLPWQGNTIAGTTDSPSPVVRDPKPTEEDVEWVLDEVRRYLSPDIQVRRGDVLSAWSGLRPLVRDPNAKSSQAIVRNHLIHVSPSGLITISGGKWTTYRAMAEETVDKAVEVWGLKPTSGCQTKTVKLIGADGWSKNMYIRLVQSFGIETEVAQHLSESYGDRAWTVLSYAQPTGRRWPLIGVRLNNNYPYIEEEVYYAVRNEYAQTAVDFIGRRTRLSFLNAGAALDSLPRVIQIMGDELGWDMTRRREEWIRARIYLESMGIPPMYENEIEMVKGWLGDRSVARSIGVWALQQVPGLKNPTSSAPTADESGKLLKVHSRALLNFDELERVKKVYSATHRETIPREEMYDVLKDLGLYPSPEVVDEFLKGVGVKANDQIGFEQLWSVCIALKSYDTEPSASQIIPRKRIPVAKAGGGL